MPNFLMRQRVRPGRRLQGASSRPIQATVIKWALDQGLLLWVIVGLALLAIAWTAVLISSYPDVRPAGLGWPDGWQVRW